MFKIKLAGHVFKIHNRYQYVENLCINYMTDKTHGTNILVTDEDIKYENGINAGYREDYLESLACYRKICEYLLDYDIILFHCSAISFDGQGYIFTAPSGTGKSTHARLWKNRFKDRVVMINDDKPVISFEKSEIIVHGTPYGGKDNLQNNISVPLRGIVILQQAPKNLICPITAREAFPKLLNQSYRRSDSSGMIKTLNLVKRLSEMPVYSLDCTISDEAVTLAYNALTKKGEI